ncbi:hypothetical protein ACJMK2_007417 [Sinanodonta woodiana]|uniref:C-terminal of Roc (COR) domain-containing protein n=1 Tax=Sinanodonta woodiana TaxID=1069815 RepID=A0ABD3VIH7_SINWO
MVKHSEYIQPPPSPEWTVMLTHSVTTHESTMIAAEEISCRQNNKGKIAAAQELYSHIIRYKEKGVGQLIEALRSSDIGLVDLADLIVPSRETKETSAELKESPEVSVLKSEVSGVESVLPPEIQCLDEKSQQLYREALGSGKERVYNIRLMVIGHQGVGKTSLVKRLLGEEVRENETESTEGIEVHTACCQIDHETKEWNKIETDPEGLVTQRMVHIIHEHVEKERSQHSADSKISQPMETDEVQSAEEKFERGESSTQKKKTSDESNKEISEFVQSAQSLTLPSNLSSSLTILDFAGQFQYYTTHQTFMSWRTMYLLVTDMSLGLTDTVKGDICVMDMSGKKLCSVQDYVIYWFNCIHSHAFLPAELNLETDMEKKDKNLSRKIPPVILVGTHCDKIPNDAVEKKKKEHFEKIRRLLQERPLRDYLVEEFAVSNVKRDSQIDDLKRRIFELAQTQDYWGQEIPARWLALRKALLQIREKKVVKYTEVESLNQSLLVKIESSEELDLFLEFEHELGNVIFFRIKELRDEVILDPQWLIQGLRSWITSDEIVKKHPNLEIAWYRFKDTGQLTETLIDFLWAEKPEFHKHKQHLLGVMEKMNIIAKPLMKDLESKDNYYWVPCMVQKSADDYNQKREGVTKTPTLCFVSQTKFIHVGVFHRLLASCLSKWQPAKIGKKYLLFNGICEFELDGCHNLVLSVNDYIIQAAVIRYSTEQEDPELAHCIIVQEYVYSALKAIAECLCPSCGFEICIQCDKSPPQSNEGLHKITDLRKGKDTRCSSHKDGTDHCVTSHELLRFWEREDLSIPSSMQTSQSDLMKNNFMKVFSLVADVGSKVLRRLLIYCTVTPNCTLDQYLKSKTNAIKKKLFLRKDQIDILFPQNGPTDLSKYDITLASALLYSIVSSLNAQDKLKVKDLRQKRNALMHAPSIVMDATEFKLKWTNIKTTLMCLMEHCQDPDFEKEILKGIKQIEQSGIDDLETLFHNYKDVKSRLEKLEKSSGDQRL